MKSLKLLRPWICELYLILSVTYYWILTGTLFNPIAIALLSILATLVVFQNKALGFMIGMILLLLNLYMVLAMISELNEFQTFNQKAIELLVFGTAYFGLNITVSIALVLKWGRNLGAVSHSTPS
jgi:hypothetical protein